MKSLLKQRKAIPAGEQMPFECPKCKTVKWVQSIVFIDWGAPNYCDKCGPVGVDFKVAKGKPIRLRPTLSHGGE